MNKRRIKMLSLIVAACLVVGLAVSSTIAYIVAKSAMLENVFKPGFIPPVQDLTVNVDVTKTVTTNTNVPYSPAGFRFQLNDSVTGEKVAVLVSDADGLAQGSLTYTYDDLGKTFGYLLTEINDGAPNVTYSDKSYYIQVHIMLDEAQDVLVPVMHMNGEVVYRLEAAFENAYYAEKPVPPTGDNMNVLLCVVLMAGSTAALIALRPRRREQ